MDKNNEQEAPSFTPFGFWVCNHKFDNKTGNVDKTEAQVHFPLGQGLQSIEENLSNLIENGAQVFSVFPSFS